MYTENRDFEKEKKNKKSIKPDIIKKDVSNFTLFSFLILIIGSIYSGIIFPLIIRNIYGLKGMELYSYSGKVHTTISIIFFIIFFIFSILFAKSRKGIVLIKVDKQKGKFIKLIMIIVFIILCIIDVFLSKDLSRMNYLEGDTVSILINGKVQYMKIQDMKDITIYNQVYSTRGKNSYDYLGVEASFYYNNKIYKLIECSSEDELNNLKLILNQFNKTNSNVKEIYVPNKYIDNGQMPTFSDLPNKYIIYIEPKSELLNRAENKHITSISYDFVNKNHNLVYDENFLTNLYKTTNETIQKETPKQDVTNNNIDLNKTETVTYSDIEDNGKHELVPVKTNKSDEKMFQYGDKVIYVVKTKYDKIIYILYKNESFSPIDYNSDTKKYTFISAGKRIYLDKNIYDTCINSL